MNPQAYRTHECALGHIWRAKVVLTRNTHRLSGEAIQYCPECNQRSVYSEPWTTYDGSPYPFDLLRGIDSNNL